MFYILNAFVWLITWIPLRLLYVFSDISFPIVYYIVRYRRAVVRLNLENSFPDKSEKEKRAIERRFYQFFCDLFVETVYEMHISEKEIHRRMTFGNLKEILEQNAKNKSVMIMTAHYGNWEWTLAFSLFSPENYPSNPIYKRLRNSRFDKLMHQLRSRYGARLIEKNDLMRVMFRLKKENEVGNFWMISDQTPNGRNIHLWTPFLNQDTPTVTGTEQLARKFDYPVFYADINRIKRGYYHCEFIPISMEPTKTIEFEITKNYMKLLQCSIEAHPEFWLWSHRRWKFKRTSDIAVN
jgi:KDO2-lipid IV(A) lauroyltransferase